MSNDGKYSLENEAKWQKFWEDSWTYRFEKDSKKPIYSIDTPPPTVSWKIHIWHIFSYTQAEVIARFKKMEWYNLFYPFWFDDNWLPTERLVEKVLWKKASEMWRQEFIAECLKITAEYRGKFKNLWQSMGFSVDWSLEYSTISSEVQKVSQKSFLDLLRKWKAYKKDSPALWCTECQTAVAQAEVEDKDFDSTFYDIRFSLTDGSPLIIATTRPELLPACVAVFVHPEDDRYLNLVWSEIITPLWTKVAILADDKVSKEKGTWAVMCCTYWDETDMYWVNKHNLESKIILNRYWKIFWTWFEDLDGLHIKKARVKIVEMLDEKGLLVASKPINHAVWVHERCSTPMEIINVDQWFLKITDIKDDLLKLWDEINWHPSHMSKRYSEWVSNLKWDWCISRQRYFGIPIPVWYSKKTWEIILPSDSDLPIDPTNTLPSKLPEWHTADDIIAESDVLDTWATSSLTPIINSKFFSENKNFDLPMDLRPQAHDIIRTWALYTIIMSYLHTSKLPFKDLMVSWHVLAAKWQKISKSKDNAWTTPEELIVKYWADPVRYWACGWSLWKDIVFDEKEIENWRRLVTKLWNAARFVLMNLEWFDSDSGLSEDSQDDIDRWIITKSENVAEKMRSDFLGYEFSHAIAEFERFFWKDFCDNYLEITKGKIANPSSYIDWDKKKLSSQIWLYKAILNIVKMIAPVLPHISEEIYQSFKWTNWKNSVHDESFPSFAWKAEEFESLDNDVSRLFDVIDLVRKTKTDLSIKYLDEPSLVSLNATSDIYDALLRFEDEIKSVSRAKEIKISVQESLACDITM